MVIFGRSFLIKLVLLLVSLEKLRIITPLKDAQVKEGQEIILNCEVNSAGAKAKWLKNSETVFESSKFVMVQRDTVFSLRIKAAEKIDEASYTITLTNQRGEQAKCSANINVLGVLLLYVYLLYHVYFDCSICKIFILVFLS